MVDRPSQYYSSINITGKWQPPAALRFFSGIQFSNAFRICYGFSTNGWLGLPSAYVGLILYQIHIWRLLCAYLKYVIFLFVIIKTSHDLLWYFCSPILRSISNYLAFIVIFNVMPLNTFVFFLSI